MTNKVYSRCHAFVKTPSSKAEMNDKLVRVEGRWKQGQYGLRFNDRTMSDPYWVVTFLGTRPDIGRLSEHFPPDVCILRESWLRPLSVHTDSVKRSARNG